MGIYGIPFPFWTYETNQWIAKNIKMFTMYWIKSYKSVKTNLLTSLIVRGYRSNSAIEFRAVI